jgi:hypothetical protein
MGATARRGEMVDSTFPLQRVDSSLESGKKRDGTRTVMAPTTISIGADAPTARITSARSATDGFSSEAGRADPNRRTHDRTVHGPTPISRRAAKSSLHVDGQRLYGFGCRVAMNL